MTTNPTRILLVGDLHANTEAALEVVDHAADVGADLIIQLGDFGFWPRIKGGQKYLRKVEARLAERGLDLWWIDGNHEDFARLATRPVGEDGRRQISEHVWHLPRGYRWAWGNARWLAVGGAVSVDQYSRTEGKSWFAEEELTEAEADRILADGGADVLLAHDAPWDVPALMETLKADLPIWRRAEKVGWPAGLLQRSDEHQRRVRRVPDGVGARVVYHGHHHRWYADVIEADHGDVVVVGLGTDTDDLDLLTLLVGSDGRPIEDNSAG